MTGGDGTYDLWAQRVDGAGNVLWGAGGKVIAAAAFDQRPNDIVADGAGGAYVTWYDLRNGADWDVYVQRLTSAGDAADGWPAGGMDLTPVPGFQIYPRVIADNDGACFVSWYDARGIANAYDIYAQRINANGTLTQGWATGGVAVCSAAGDQDYPVLASDGSHGVLVAWQDWRTDGDVYAQRVRFNGALGDTLPTNGVGPTAAAEFAIGSVFPNPSRTGALRVALALPNGAPARLSLFDAQGRLVTGRTVQLAGGGRATLALAAPERLAAGVYLLRLEQFGRTATRSVSIMK
jgi:hypothetical protein